MHVNSFVEHSQAVEFASLKKSQGYFTETYPPIDKNTKSITGRWLVWWH